MTHNIFRKTAALTFGLVTATAIVAACGTDGDTYDPAPTSTQQPVLTGPEGSLKSPEQQATEAATAKINEFYAVLASIQNDPAVDINRLDGVAVDPVLAGIKGDITTQRSKGVVSSGAITVLDTSVTRQEAPKDAEGNPPIAGEAFVEMRTCVDISALSSTLPDGTSALSPNRAPELAKFTVRNAAWPDASGWRIASQPTKPGTSCDSP